MFSFFLGASVGIFLPGKPFVDWTTPWYSVAETPGGKADKKERRTVRSQTLKAAHIRCKLSIVPQEE